ncbi:competence protein CoiA [Fodinibius sp. SL11]|uniref:competence protein CoiA n=1 Tax=Fodinibius sp. SL11 TaxID=3425690 RepID=UPI003F882E3C
MLVALNSNRERCHASDSKKSEGPYFCPDSECGGELILRKGSINIHHFAHKSTDSCSYSSGESELHYKCKTDICKTLEEHELCKNCDIERSLGEVRPDISLRINNFPVGIEVQKSTIDVREIIRRTKIYKEKKIFVLWIIPSLDQINFGYDVELEKYTFKPKAWQRLLHQMYYGRLYIWTGNASISPLHYEDLIYYKEETNWVEENYGHLEGTDWYREQHEFAYSGGYEKKSKTRKEIRWSEDNTTQFFHIAEDFKPIERQKYNKLTNWDLPSAYLWIDKSKNWW